ncbi:uncharacterized protein LOC109371073 [Meleagris gallopavo]|uniref:uncharacterized protein LOC109371073 n=1 Tax=Meleagris gallopavo TaxID=9103 RepID=UPI0012AC13E0|nr:uncharacterized protein LOC109371073 [Meleagris gallopavo]XP_031412843.1 uncharacterized protein LOC109371073 [Meleagris gallopavo]
MSRNPLGYLLIVSYNNKCLIQTSEALPTTLQHTEESTAEMWGCFGGELPQFWCPSPLCLFAVPPINSFASSRSAPGSAPLCFPRTQHHCTHQELPKTFPTSFSFFFFFPFSFCPFAFHFPIPCHYGLPHRQSHGDKMAVRQPFCGSRQWLRAALCSPASLCLLLPWLHGAERTLRNSAFPSGKSCPCPAHFGTELSAAAIQRLKAAPALNGATLLLHGFLPPPPPFHSVLLNKPDQLLKAVQALFQSSVPPRFERQRLCWASSAFRPTDSCGSTMRHLLGVPIVGCSHFSISKYKQESRDGMDILPT